MARIRRISSLIEDMMLGGFFFLCKQKKSLVLHFCQLMYILGKRNKLIQKLDVEIHF